MSASTRIKTQINQQLERFDNLSSYQMLQVKAASYLATFISGVAVGLFVLGWWLMPVTWTAGGYYSLADTYKVELVYVAADLFAYSLDTEQAGGFLGGWEGGELACELAGYEANLGKRARLLALTSITGTDCN